ncbi:MAG: tetratricopeptide repeat protein [Firmicutes bacterium]|nr:tetratricopeptide repeat protein [Bacillota bacterium]
MFFQKMRQRTKFIIIIVVAAMAGGLLWAGGAQLFGGRGKQQQPVEAVVAMVNGQGITYYDLHQMFIQKLQQIEQQQGRVPGSAYQSIKYQALESLVGSVLLSQEISERKITASKDEIEKELQSIIDQFPSVEDYKFQLEAAGLTEEYLKAGLAEELKFNKLKNEILADIPVSEEEIKSAYERVRASHILITPEERTEEGWAEAKEKAVEIWEQVTVDNFSEFAEAYSEDGSKSQGGDLGFVGKGQTIPEFETVVFSLEVDEISEPVRSEYGYHIITVTERKEAQGEEFEQVYDALAEMVRDEKGQKDLAAWFEELRDKADVIFTDHEMNAFQQANLGNYEDAVHYYKLALEERPDDGYLYAALGDVFKEQGGYEDAIVQYELAVEKYDNDHQLYIALAGLYREVDQVEKAVDAYLTASELVPNDIFAQLTLYQSLNELERYDEARIIEDRIAEFQERQKELLEAEEPAAEESNLEAEPSQEEADPED